MKKSLYILMTCLLFVACSKNEVEDNTTHANQIGFGVYAGRSVTKASSFFVDGTTVKNIPQNDTIGVFGYFHKGTSSTVGAWSGTDTPNLFNNVPVKATASDGSAFTYSPARYWPMNVYDRISFIAYYPYGSKGKGITPSVTSGFGSYAFQTQSKASNQVDFMLSDLAENQSKKAGILTGSTTNTVKLNFHHVLSQVTVKVTTGSYPTGVSAVIDSVILAKVAAKGTCTPSFSGTPASDGSTNTTFTWSRISGLQNFEIANGSNAAADILLMVPQAFDKNPDAVIKVYYTITMPDNDPTDSRTTITISGNMKSVKLLNGTTSGGAAVTSWEQNKKYTYNLVLGLDAILFDATVDDWAQASSDIKL